VESLGEKRPTFAHHRHPLPSRSRQASLAAIKRLTGAPVYMHASDAAMVRKGEKQTTADRCARLATLPDVQLVRRQLAHQDWSGVPSITKSQTALICQCQGGLRAIHAPGHCAGQLVFLWPRRRVLFVADAASNLPTFGLSLGYENLTEGLRSLAKIAALDFGHRMLRTRRPPLPHRRRRSSSRNGAAGATSAAEAAPLQSDFCDIDGRNPEAPLRGTLNHGLKPIFLRLFGTAEAVPSTFQPLENRSVLLLKTVPPTFETRALTLEAIPIYNQHMPPQTIAVACPAESTRRLSRLCSALRGTMSSG